MLAKTADAIPAGGSLLYEPKSDGCGANVFRGGFPAAHARFAAAPSR